MEEEDYIHLPGMYQNIVSIQLISLTSREHWYDYFYLVFLHFLVSIQLISLTSRETICL